MINIQVKRVEDGIRVSGEMGAESTDALIEELACLCSDAIDMMAREYEGKDDIGEALERSLAEEITRRRAWNAEERHAQEEQEAQAMRCTDGDNAATYRPGQWRAGMDYDGAAWRDHSIRAARFAPCPHCGSTVAGRERTLSAAHRFGPAVFRRAECKNPECGWSYWYTGGTRDEFVHLVNRRAKEARP